MIHDMIHDFMIHDHEMIREPGFVLVFVSYQGR